MPGVNAGVSAMANWDPDGPGPLPTALVVGGVFTMAGGTEANYIAMRNPSTGKWAALGSGMDGPVRALAVLPNGNLVAGGEFAMAGGAAASKIARWDGTSWSALGTGMNTFGEIWALAVLLNGDLVAGGEFTTAGGVAVNYIARWNGTSWSPLGTGMNAASIVASLAVMPNGDLVAGGRFNTAGGISANHIARWNGTAWSALGSGMSNNTSIVRALAVLPNGDLVAAGAFFLAGGLLMQNIARWDGAAWDHLGEWPDDGVNNVVTSLAVLPSGDVVAGGFFLAAGLVPTSHVARWNGAVWSPLGTGLDDLVFALTVLPTGDLMVGGSFATAGGVSAEHIARWNGTAWFEPGADVDGTFAIAASDAAAGDWFGDVAIDGDTIVVGARKNDNATGVDAGAAYVYVRSGPPESEVWTQQGKLIGDTTFGEAGSQSGVSVAISGNTALVGSYLWPSGNATGMLYVFVRSGPPGSEVWTQQAALQCPQFGSFQYYGVSVSFEGDTAVIGSLSAPGGYGGSAFFFARSGPPGGESWTSQQVHPSDGVSGDQFGVSVAMSPAQDAAVVGAHLDDNAGGADAGSAYVFIKSGSSWIEQAKLTASDGAALDQFGRQVAIDGDTIVVGSRLDDNAGGANAGAAYVFTRSGSVWTQQAKLTASDAAAGDEFGLALALSGDTVIVGAYADDNAGGVDAGSAYVFTRSGPVWTEQFKLTSPEPGAGDIFGGSVALSGDTAVVGALFDDHAGGVDAGSVYVFDLGCETVCCPGDFDANHIVTILDIPNFVTALLVGGACPAAPACCPGDLNTDGLLNGGDVSGFVVKLLSGGACP